jgi:hypothetical protein
MDLHRRQLLRAGLSAPVLGLAGQASAEPAERLSNKAVVRAYIEATDRGDMATIEALAGRQMVDRFTRRLRQTDRHGDQPSPL